MKQRLLKTLNTGLQSRHEKQESVSDFPYWFPWESFQTEAQNLRWAQNVPWDEETYLIDQENKDTKFHRAEFQREDG